MTDDHDDRDELDSKAVYWTSGVVNVRLWSTFDADACTDAAVLLSGLVGEDPGGDAEVSDIATCRLMLAALKLSQGDLTRLALWVEAAHNDPRDLIVAAEYPHQLAEATEASAEQDLAEYLAWVQG